MTESGTFTAGACPRSGGPVETARSYIHTLRVSLRELRGRKLEPEVPYMARFIGPDSVCVQIGASDGRHGFQMARLARRGAVHCIEPSPYTFEIMGRLRRLFGFHNLHIHRLAVSDQPGTAYLVTPVKKSGHLGRAFAFLSTAPLQDGERLQGTDFKGFISEAVTVRTLDGFCRDEGLGRVDFIRCDVEGSERSVLAGGEDTIRHHRPVMMMEVHPHMLAQRFQSSAEQVWSHLSSLGYRMFYLAGHALVEADYFFDEPWRDYFCVPDDRVDRYDLKLSSAAHR